MIDGPVLVDSDTLSELSRNHPRVTGHARRYMMRHGRLTISAMTVFERLRGYRAAVLAGKPYQDHERRFRAFAATCRVLAFDGDVADEAANIWAQLGLKRRRALGDIVIAATASTLGIPLVSRNRRDFEAIAKLEDVRLTLVDWTT